MLSARQKATPSITPTYSPGQQGRWMENIRARITEVEADLHDQGIALFPASRGGHHAQLLWRRIKQHLFRGGAVQITTSALGLLWHREELRRARNVLIEIELIRLRDDGLYVLGRYDWLDEEVRERFSELRVVEEVLIALSSIVVKDPHAP
jgi:hypothetical protein